MNEFEVDTVPHNEVDGINTPKKNFVSFRNLFDTGLLVNKNKLL